MRRHFLLGLAGLVLTPALVLANDLTKIERKIAKEPKYLSPEPLYGLLVFGPKAQTSAWVVLDKSQAGAEAYDVLYFDRTGKGDLTFPAHKFTSPKEDGGQLKFELGDFTDPRTGDKHTDLSVSIGKESTPNVMVRLTWKGGKVKMAGGYPEDPGDYMKFARQPDQAPVLWFHGDGNFRFQRWYGATLNIGEENDFKVFLGQLGVGRSSFCAIMHPFLPDEVPVLATLVYTDKDGREETVKHELKQRC
jgi:hypothetical protein